MSLVLVFVVVLVMLVIATELNHLRRSQQEATAILRRLAEATAPGTTGDVPVTTGDDPRSVLWRKPRPPAKVAPADNA